MLLHEYHIPKSIKHTILEFENFVLINGSIYNKTRLKIPEGGWAALKFDQLLGAINNAMRYSNHDLKALQKCRTYVKHAYRDEYETRDKFWIELANEGKFDPETQMALLNEFDRDPSVLTAFAHYDHSLWDWNMKRLTVPVVLDYICSQLDNSKYRLRSLLTHLESMDRSNLLDISYPKEIMDIPYYNRSEDRNRCLILEVVFKQEVYDGICLRAKDSRKQSAIGEKFATGYYFLDSDKVKQEVTTILGFKQFEKPENPDKDD